MLETFWADARLLRVKDCSSGWTGRSTSCSVTQASFKQSNARQVQVKHVSSEVTDSHCGQERRTQASSYYDPVAQPLN